MTSEALPATIATSNVRLYKLPKTPTFFTQPLARRSGCVYVYVAAKATLYSFASRQNRLFGGFFGPSSVKKGRTHIVLGRNM